MRFFESRWSWKEEESTERKCPNPIQFQIQHSSEQATKLAKVNLVEVMVEVISQFEAAAPQKQNLIFFLDQLTFLDPYSCRLQENKAYLLQNY